MYRYKCIVAYDGYNYMGFQIQNDLNTIELQLKQALYKMLALDIKIYPSGRTDRYVHAINQVFHFDLEKNIPTMGILRGLNSYLPKDIRIKSVELVDESFHSRFSAKSKEYRYYVYQGSDNPFIMRYALVLRNLNIDKMQEAIKLFEGKHDFKGFADSVEYVHRDVCDRTGSRLDRSLAGRQRRNTPFGKTASIISGTCRNAVCPA